MLVPGSIGCWLRVWFGCSRHGRTSLRGSKKISSPEAVAYSKCLAAFGLRTKTCAPPLFHIHVQMVLVGFICIGPKYRAKGLARLIVYRFQKVSLAVVQTDSYSLYFDSLTRYPTRVVQGQRRAGRTIGRVLDHGNLLSRGKHEIGDVDCIGECMFA